jgi:hypothetical protein
VREALAAAQDTAARGGEAAQRAARARDELVERSQLHRLAATLFGRQDRETLERTKRLFVVSLAGIVALIGTVIAAMHYAVAATAAQGEHEAEGTTAPRPRRRGPLSAAVRAYLARRRRALSLKPVLQVQEVVRTVEVPVDRLKLVYLPLEATEQQVAAVRREAAAGQEVAA